MMSRFCFCMIAIFFFNDAIAQDLFAAGPAHGKYTVGFKTIDVIDHNRSDIDSPQTTAGRKMTIHIWYPAKKTKGYPISYKNYVELLSEKKKRTFDDTRKSFFRSVMELSGDTALFSSVYTRLIGSKTSAFLNAAVDDGEFPLVIYPDNPYAQSILCEYLASAGYIVASPVLQGTYSHQMEYNVRGIETAVTDIQFTLGYIRTHYKVQRDFCVMGTGFNATLALSTQMRNRDVKAIVSLEGGITTGFEKSLIELVPYFSIEKCDAPMLIIHAPHPDVHPELTHRYKYSERVYQCYAESSEFYFLNYGVWEKRIPGIFSRANRGNTWDSFCYAAKSINHYLNWKLKGQNQAGEYLLNNTWPKDLVLTSIVAADKTQS